MKPKRWIFLVICIFLVAALAGFSFWASQVSGPSTAAQAALQSDGSVSVKVSADRIEFSPAQKKPDTGFIFYPGGKVDYRSYAPMLKAVSAHGYLVVVVHMPLNLAVFGSGKAAEVMAAYPAVKTWAAGGHSLGGSMAAHFAVQHPELIKGLVLWASYPAEADSLAASSVQVVSISGTRDGLSTPAKIDASRKLLPTATTWVVIEGGNHAQFGSYGPQSGDQQAAIDAASQQTQIVTATTDFLHSLEGK